jgi:hypothetical protein
MAGSMRGHGLTVAVTVALAVALALALCAAACSSRRDDPGPAAGSATAGSATAGSATAGASAAASTRADASAAGDASPEDRARAWREDLRALATELPKRHLDAFFRVPEADWRRSVDELDRGLAALDDARATVGLVRLVAALGDAHSHVKLLGRAQARRHRGPPGRCGHRRRDATDRA